MTLNFFKAFSFPNANGLETLVIVRGKNAPIIPARLSHFEIIEFSCLDEARKFGHEIVKKLGFDAVVEHGMSAVDFL